MEFTFLEHLRTVLVFTLSFFDFWVIFTYNFSMTPLSKNAIHKTTTALKNLVLKTCDGNHHGNYQSINRPIRYNVLVAVDGGPPLKYSTL